MIKRFFKKIKQAHCKHDWEQNLVEHISLGKKKKGRLVEMQKMR